MIGDAWLDRPPSPPRLRGLVRNPATPIYVLLRLLSTRPEQVCEGLRRRRELQPSVQDAMLHHPSPRIRGALATHPQADPQTRATLLADPEWLVRMRAFGRPGQRSLSDDVLVRLLAELDDPPPLDTPFTRTDLTGEQLTQLATDPAVEVRTAVSTHPGLTEQQRAGIDIDVTTVPGDGHFGTPDVRCRSVPHRDPPVPELADSLR